MDEDIEDYMTRGRNSLKRSVELAKAAEIVEAIGYLSLADHISKLAQFEGEKAREYLEFASVISGGDE